MFNYTIVPNVSICAMFNYNIVLMFLSMFILQEAVNIIKTVFVAASERDIHTGDSVEIKIITRDGVRTEIMDLKKD